MVEAAQEGQTPVNIARSEFNQTLFAPDFKGDQVVSKIVALQTALLGSNLPPTQIYHDLSIAAGQAAERARTADDQTAAITLSGMSANFELTRQAFTPQEQPASPAKPADTATLPMTSAKTDPRKERPANPPKAESQDKKTLSPRQTQILDLIRNNRNITSADLRSQLSIDSATLAKELTRIRPWVKSKGQKIESKRVRGTRFAQYSLVDDVLPAMR